MRIQFTIRDIFELSARLWVSVICLSYLVEKVTEHYFIVKIIAIIFLIWSGLPLVKEETKWKN